MRAEAAVKKKPRSHVNARNGVVLINQIHFVTNTTPFAPSTVASQHFLDCRVQLSSAEEGSSIRMLRELRAYYPNALGIPIWQNKDLAAVAEVLL
jgi:hypothetical protein